MKKNKNIEEKVYSVEELAEFIHTSPLMKVGPKKPMSLFTKIIIFIVILAIGIFVYFKFIYVPYVYTIDFTPNVYKFSKFNFITKDGGIVIIGTNELDLEENVSNILPFVDYSDRKKNYAIFLSEHGNLYLYDIDNNNISNYYNGEIKIRYIEEKQLDNIIVIEATFENSIKRILGMDAINDNSVDDVKIMDEIIYSIDDIYIYILNNKVSACKYSEVSHYDILKDEIIPSDKIEKYFVDDQGNQIEIVDYDYFKKENNIYLYFITKDGKLALYIFDTEKYDDLINQINVKTISFSYLLESFEKENELKNGVRIKINDEDRYIDIIENNVIYGSLSNDLSLLTYTSDIFYPSNYIITESDEGNNKYKDKYLTDNDENNLVIVYLNFHDELLVTTISLENLSDVNTKKVKLGENISVDKLYVDSKEAFITLKEVVNKNYVVFENETYDEYHTYKLNEYLEGVEYYE